MNAELGRAGVGEELEEVLADFFLGVAGEMRQLVLAVSVPERALGAWPAESMVATQVVCRVKL